MVGSLLSPRRPGTGYTGDFTLRFRDLSRKLQIRHFQGYRMSIDIPVPYRKSSHSPRIWRGPFLGLLGWGQVKVRIADEQLLAWSWNQVRFSGYCQNVWTTQGTVPQQLECQICKKQKLLSSVPTEHARMMLWLDPSHSAPYAERRRNRLPQIWSMVLDIGCLSDWSSTIRREFPQVTQNDYMCGSGGLRLALSRMWDAVMFAACSTEFTGSRDFWQP